MQSFPLLQDLIDRDRHILAINLYGTERLPNKNADSLV